MMWYIISSDFCSGYSRSIWIWLITLISVEEKFISKLKYWKAKDTIRQTDQVKRGKEAQTR
jgi:hypothetical protein